MQTWAEGHDGEEVILWMSSKGFPHNHQEHIFRLVGCLSGCVCLCGCVDARESLFDANNKIGIQSEFKLLPMNLSASRQRFRTKTNPNKTLTELMLTCPCTHVVKSAYRRGHRTHWALVVVMVGIMEIRSEKSH